MVLDLALDLGMIAMKKCLEMHVTRGIVCMRYNKSSIKVLNV